VALYLELSEEISRRAFVLTGAQMVVGVISAVVASACVLVHYELMSLTSRMLPRVRVPRRTRIVLLIFSMLAAHVVEVWLFALAYWQMDRWPALGQLTGDFEEGAFDFVYYSVTCFTTLGFGDIVPTGPVRILTGTEALVGLGLITWSASFGFLEMQRDGLEFSRGRQRIREAQRGSREEGRG
jgi:hypothetical protein